MIHYQVSNVMMTDCWKILESTDLGQRKHFNGSREEQLVGLVGENAVREMLGMPLNDGSGGCDDGYDVLIEKIRVDVKTMGRSCSPKSHYVNNLVAAQISRKAYAYIFCSLNKTNRILTVCGWVTKATMLDKANFFSKGTPRKRSDGSTFPTKADLYEIENRDIVDVNSIDDLTLGIGGELPC